MSSKGSVICSECKLVYKKESALHHVCPRCLLIAALEHPKKDLVIPGGMTTEEIAYKLNISDSTVRSIEKKALFRIRKINQMVYDALMTMPVQSINRW